MGRRIGSAGRCRRLYSVQQQSQLAFTEEAARSGVVGDTVQVSGTFGTVPGTIY